ncbi:hypothetical protein [Streptomyces lavendofoliae]|uniref:hypothetical protein n=1 Tax=Streptomyces lavendofoliae TaxID=67314 RepID=UPI00300E7941
MSDSTQQPAEQSAVEPVQPPAPEPPVQQPAPERAAEPTVTFLRRHGAVILLALLFLGYVLHERPVLRETIGVLAAVAASGIALMAVVLVRRQ